jgi:hypothetical protein
MLGRLKTALNFSGRTHTFQEEQEMAVKKSAKKAAKKAVKKSVKKPVKKVAKKAVKKPQAQSASKAPAQTKESSKGFFENLLKKLGM